MRLDNHGRENHKGMIAVVAVADGTTIQSTPQLAGHHAVRSALRFFGDPADLDRTLSFQQLAEGIPLTTPIISDQHSHDVYHNLPINRPKHNPQLPAIDSGRSL